MLAHDVVRHSSAIARHFDSADAFDDFMASARDGVGAGGALGGGVGADGIDRGVALGEFLCRCDGGGGGVALAAGALGTLPRPVADAAGCAGQH